MKFLYKQNYMTKILVIGLISAVLCIFSHKANYIVIPMPQNDIPEYHTNILTINSIFSGFALTNLGILLTMSDDQLIKKLEGTDILKKRNVVIGHSIIFGAISIFISVFWVLKINLSFFSMLIGKECFLVIREFFFYVEIISLVISIFYFLLSVEKMIQLLNLLHIPRKRYSDKQVDELRKRIFGKDNN